MQVRDLLKGKGDAVYAVKPTDSVYNAIEKMAELNIGAMVVLNGEKLAGIISERDYRNKVILKGRTSKEAEVLEIMTDQVFCVKPEDSVNLCMKLMTEQKIRHLPVINKEEKVVGVISIGDVVKTVIEKQKIEIDSLRNFISGGYPG
jgi:CBS domain-containing protein